jgi:large subunit ribosomal protein L28
MRWRPHSPSDFLFNKKTTAMSKVCQISGKKPSVGNNVSHSKRRTKRKFNVNLHKKKFYWVEQDMWIELLVSAHALRTINKIGLNAALKKAEKEGNLDFKDITIVSL